MELHWSPWARMGPFGKRREFSQQSCDTREPNPSAGHCQMTAPQAEVQNTRLYSGIYKDIQVGIGMYKGV